MLLKIRAVGFSFQTPIIFKSGIKSPVYVDNRCFPSYPEYWRKILKGFASLLTEKKIPFDIVAGVEAGGIPHSAALGYLMNKPSVFVRKQAKDHGTKKMVEGGNVRGKRVLLVEDLVTTGSSSLAAVESLRQEGAEVTDCLVIVSYNFPEARNNFEQARVWLHALTPFPVILQEAADAGLLSEQETAVVRQFLADPRHWLAQGLPPTPTRPGMIDKYNLRADKVNSLVCVGLDSDIDKLPEKFKNMPLPQFEFNKYIIEQTHPYAAAFKFNIAFYEERGDQGIKELKMSTDYLKENYPDIFRICDCKRGDIGSTNKGYVGFIMDWLDFDAMTISPYLGKEALEPFLCRKDKGCIVLCRTSNPGAGYLQDLIAEGRPVWEIVAERVKNEWNANNNCLLVVGATYPAETAAIRKIAGEMTFLMPGVGAQGGDIAAAVKAGLNSQSKGLIINSSRGIIFSDNPAEEAKKLRDEINKYR